MSVEKHACNEDDVILGEKAAAVDRWSLLRACDRKRCWLVHFKTHGSGKVDWFSRIA